MSEAKHTRGPWRVEQNSKFHREWRITAATPRPGRRFTVATVADHSPEDSEMAKADAALIAAAPDLLAAICKLDAVLELSDDPSNVATLADQLGIKDSSALAEALQFARAAIARTKGGDS